MSTHMTDRPVCTHCWHPFSPASPAQKYCSPECREDAARQRHLDRPCPRCGQPLERPRVQFHPWCRKDGGIVRKRAQQWRRALKETP